MAEATAAPSTDRYQVSDEVLKHFIALRADAVSQAVEVAETASPQKYARFGARGRDACAEDVNFHLDFLRPTLETNDIKPFVSYLAWLGQVLDSRGVPLPSVSQSLDDLAAFFYTRLGPSGLPIAAALTAGRQALAGGIAAPGYDLPCPARREEAQPYSASALSGNRSEAVSLLERAFVREDSLPLVAVHVIQPAMYDIGRLWQQNHVSVAQEHLATALSESWMAPAMARAKAAPDNSGRAVLACLAGNQHVLGLRMVADAFELDGWSVEFLGANTAFDALVERVRVARPHVVGLSASLPQHLSGLRQAVSGLREAFGAACPRIAAGGLVINQFPGLADWAGAEVLGADAITAATAAAQQLACRSA